MIGNHLFGACLPVFGDCADRFVLSEGTAYGFEKKAILRNNWKLIHSKGDKIDLLFNLSDDPKEKHDLSTENTEELKRLQSALPQTSKEGRALRVDNAVKEQLKALGYM